MEMSRRSQTFDESIRTAESRMRRLVNLPDDYSILFMQGGASSQFTLIPLNLAGVNFQIQRNEIFELKGSIIVKKKGRMTVIVKFSPSRHDAASTGYPLEAVLKTLLGFNVEQDF
jgi:phosphoserine aminotransferase